MRLTLYGDGRRGGISRWIEQHIDVKFVIDIDHGIEQIRQNWKQCSLMDEFPVEHVTYENEELTLGLIVEL